MQTEFYFFHGYGSDVNSGKYLALYKHFSKKYNMENEVWRLNDNIEQIISRVYDKLEYDENPILFGDSTGANFAYQIRERRKQAGKSSILIMSAPLLDFSTRSSLARDFSKNIQQYLMKITEPQDAMVIVPSHDEIVDQSIFLKQNNLQNIELLILEDTHRLGKLKAGEGMQEIENYINKQGPKGV